MKFMVYGNALIASCTRVSGLDIIVFAKTSYVYCRFYHRIRKNILFHYIFCKLTEWILLNKIAFKSIFSDLNYLERFEAKHDLEKLKWSYFEAFLAA